GPGGQRADLGPGTTHEPLHLRIDSKIHRENEPVFQFGRPGRQTQENKILAVLRYDRAPPDFFPDVRVARGMARRMAWVGGLRSFRLSRLLQVREALGKGDIKTP